MNILAWNNKIGPWYYFVGLRTWVMINRDRRGYSYCIVRGEILGFLQDELLRKHLARMFSFRRGPGQPIDETIVGATAVLNRGSGMDTFGDFIFTGSYVARHMVREKVVVTMVESITSARLRLYIFPICKKMVQNSQ